MQLYSSLTYLHHVHHAQHEDLICFWLCFAGLKFFNSGLPSNGLQCKKSLLTQVDTKVAKVQPVPVSLPRVCCKPVFHAQKRIFKRIQIMVSMCEKRVKFNRPRISSKKHLQHHNLGVSTWQSNILLPLMRGKELGAAENEFHCLTAINSNL